jgi:hypothetical protein
MKPKQVKDLMEAYASIYSTISESHFKVGDEVICKASGMEGEVIKVDPEGKGKYYTVKHEDGKTMKYAPDELKLEKEEKEEKEDEKEEKEDEKEDMKEAKHSGASEEEETKFHKKLDKMVHKTFGKRKEEKKMEEGYISEDPVQDYRDMKREKENAAGMRGPELSHSTKSSGGSAKQKSQKSEPRSREFAREEVETDLFGYLLEYLVAEGYADTNKAALAIMANMSEEWKQDIVEQMTGGPTDSPSDEKKSFTGEGPKKPKGWKPTGPKLKPGQRPGYAR